MNIRKEEMKLRYTSGIVDNFISKIIDFNSPKTDFKSPLFIMGSGRNGSTLLSCILNNHPQICIPVEHSFIPASIKYWYSHPFQNWNQKVNSILNYLEKTNYWKLDLDDIRNKISFLETPNQHLNSIIEIVYRHIAERNGKQNTVWGDKTPSNTQFIKLMKSHLPASKVLFLVRDPRDYMVSSLQLKTQRNYQFDFLIWRWLDALSKYSSLKSRYMHEVRILKYESLVSDAEKEVQALVAWLGLEPSSNLLEGYSKNMKLLHVENVAHHQRIIEPITTNSIERWKSELTPSQIRKIERLTKRQMLDLGYAFSS